jgi:glycosyltransferase involved in cell wall biosynthesis
MLSGRDIIVISSIEWDFNWQGHQEIARRLAQSGNRVLYVENMGVRTPRFRDARRVVDRAANWMQSLPVGGVREVLPNLHVCSPLVLPPFGSKARQLLNRRVLLPLIRRAVEKLNFRSDIIWTYLPTDTVGSLIHLLRTPRGLTVYYCIADFAELTPFAKEIMASERAVIEMSDVVFAQCEQLAERCSRHGKGVGIFPFGVNLDLFTPANDMGNRELQKKTIETSEPALISSMMSKLPRPIIGYVGGIHRHFDTKMLAAMANAKPDWSWVLIGPVQTHLNALEQIPNVHLLGSKAHKELPEYIANIDVGIVPYLRNEYTMTVVPTKINEYLAMGKPVVSTDLPQVRVFNDEHDVLIMSPNRTGEFLARIESALSLPNGEAIIARRREVAALSDWDMRIERMSNMLEQSLLAR